MILTALLACSTFESNINSLDLTLHEEHFFVDVMFRDSQCRDVTALHDSTLGGLAVDVVQDSRAYQDGTGMQVDEFGIWVDTGGCAGNLGLGFEDVSSLADTEIVPLVFTGESKTYTIELTNWPLAHRQVIPDRPLVADELWGETYTFTLDGPGEIRPDCFPRLYGPGETMDLDADEVVGASWTVSGNQIQVTFPTTNPLPVEPEGVELVRLWDLDALSPFSSSDALGEADFYIAHQTDKTADVPILPD